MSESASRMYAYEICDPSAMPLTRAPVHRVWMKASKDNIAYRCLPLVMANQNGWVMGCPATVIARWNGGPATTDLWLGGETDSPPAPAVAVSAWGGSGAQPGAAPHPWIVSRFGNGILSFSVPYIFRTPPGINLWVKGPSNWIKDGLFPLEGIVETDWAAGTFTMNWQLTRPGLPVRFLRGEPVCMVVPIPRGLAESLEPRRAPLQRNPELEAAYQVFRQRRAQFEEALMQGQPEAVAQGWEKQYFQGRNPGGPQFEGHQTHIALKEFEPEQ